MLRYGLLWLDLKADMPGSLGLETPLLTSWHMNSRWALAVEAELLQRSSRLVPQVNSPSVLRDGCQPGKHLGWKGQRLLKTRLSTQVRPLQELVDALERGPLDMPIGMQEQLADVIQQAR
jgi:hypothetical protein